MKKYKIFKHLINFHTKLIDQNVTYEEIKLIRLKTIFDVDIPDPFKIFKDLYFIIFNIISNIFISLLYQKNNKSSQYIKEIITTQSSNNCESIKILRKKSDFMFDKYKDLNIYSGVVKWIAGNCWINALITNDYIDLIEPIDQEIFDSIKKAVELVDPIESPIVLFHGFEKYSNYNVKDLFIGNIWSFNGILSKTVNFKIAQSFATAQNYFKPSYLIVFYPANSKHIGLDTKAIFCDEFEYIGKPGEKFKIIDIHEISKGLFLETYYICLSLDY